jgi:hypothetical protein
MFVCVVSSCIGRGLRDGVCSSKLVLQTVLILRIPLCKAAKVLTRTLEPQVIMI